MRNSATSNVHGLRWNTSKPNHKAAHTTSLRALHCVLGIFRGALFNQLVCLRHAVQAINKCAIVSSFLRTACVSKISHTTKQTHARMPLVHNLCFTSTSNKWLSHTAHTLHDCKTHHAQQDTCIPAEAKHRTMAHPDATCTPAAPLLPHLLQQHVPSVPTILQHSPIDKLFYSLPALWLGG